LTDFGGKTSIFSHPVYLFLRKFSLQDSRGGSPSVKATQIGFGQLSRAQQVLGIGYLYVEAQLRQI
ncbi:hypothetical protein, partial [Escherichia coli]